MNHQVLLFDNGSASIRNSSLGVCMHSMIGPWQEAQSVYIRPSQLKSRLLQPSSFNPCCFEIQSSTSSLSPLPHSQITSDLVLYDIGFGIGANSMAAWETFKNIPNAKRSIRIFSFEIDLEGLREALRSIELFPFLQRNEFLCRQLLQERQVYFQSSRGASLTWKLLEGDFKSEMQSLPEPELIYYDLYSPRSTPFVWTKECFDLLYQKTQKRRAHQLPTDLFTYSAATNARNAMRHAGFYVKKGSPTATKRETTIASSFPFS